MAKKKIAHRGEFWSINDKRTRGHKTFIIRGNKYKHYVLHLPITHSKQTRNMKNQILRKNPEFGKNEDAYILTRVQKSPENKLGKKHSNMKIKNTTDKKVVRHIIKNNKKK